MDTWRCTGKLASALAAALALATPAIAQVGESIDKNMSGNITIDPASMPGIPPEAEHAFIKYLRTYVPAQRSDGTLADPVEYNNADGVLVKTRPVAKPLIGAFVYGPVDYPEPVGEENVEGFVGHGKRDVYAAVSLDDGTTWKTSNLSMSAEEFSHVLPDYPAEAVNVVHAVAGNHIAVAWPSRYCSTGSPAYTIDPDVTFGRNLDEVAAYLGINLDADLYLTDLFGVAGSQGSVDYTEQGYPTVGEVPFNCLWTVRGVLVLGDDPRTSAVESSHVVWYKPERLTSSTRDVNRVEIQMVRGAGVAVIWQEDPAGLLQWRAGSAGPVLRARSAVRRPLPGRGSRGLDGSDVPAGSDYSWCVLQRVRPSDHWQRSLGRGGQPGDEPGGRHALQCLGAVHDCRAATVR